LIQDQTIDRQHMVSKEWHQLKAWTWTVTKKAALSNVKEATILNANCDDGVGNVRAAPQPPNQQKKKREMRKPGRRWSQRPETKVTGRFV
jgi:hypothetical protein